jgi:hypothetical protein
VYRFLYSLDSSASEVGPAARIEVRRSHRTLHLADGTTILRGDRIGILHLNNDSVVALHAAGLPPIAVGLEFRRQLFGSLHALARLAGPGGWLSDVRAFEATTIFFHQWLGRAGFEADRDGLAWPGLVAAYQHALLALPASCWPGSARQSDLPARSAVLDLAREAPGTLRRMMGRRLGEADQQLTAGPVIGEAIARQLRLAEQVRADADLAPVRSTGPG